VDMQKAPLVHGKPLARMEGPRARLFDDERTRRGEIRRQQFALEGL
jgi:hypothetical protein